MIIRSTGALFNDAFAFYKSHYKLLAGLTLISGVLQAIMSYLAPTETHPLSGDIALLMLIVAFAAAVFVGIVVTASLVLAVSEPARFKNPLEALMAGKKFFLPMIWVGLLSSLVIIGGFILLIIPGIIFIVWYSFVYYTLVLEGKRGWEAMKASKGYVTGKWWPVFGRMMALIAVLLALTLIVEFLVSRLMLAEHVHTAISALITSLYSPFVMAYMYFMYTDLKEAPHLVPVEELADEESPSSAA